MKRVVVIGGGHGQSIVLRGIKKIPDLRGRIRKLIKKYDAEAEFAEFTEIPATDNETAPSPGDIDDLIEKP